MRKLKEHVNRWNHWRCYSKSGVIHKLLVLFGLRKDIGFELTLTDKENEEIIKRAEEISMMERYVE